MPHVYLSHVHTNTGVFFFFLKKQGMPLYMSNALQMFKKRRIQMLKEWARFVGGQNIYIIYMYYIYMLYIIYIPMQVRGRVKEAC